MSNWLECRTVFCFLVEHRETHFGNPTFEPSYRRKSPLFPTLLIIWLVVLTRYLDFPCLQDSMLLVYQTWLSASETARPTPNTAVEMNVGATLRPSRQMATQGRCSRTGIWEDRRARSSSASPWVTPLLAKSYRRLIDYFLSMPS